mgnify:CR=1 FL=1|tara:strand:+ start:1020 stop:1943 length:924 start_codon:yes stop_codon:yes gene_type:complete
MKYINPITITDSLLDASNVTEADATEWTSGGSFSTGQTCMVTTTANGAATATHKIYESVHVGINSGHDPTVDDGTNWTELSSTNRYKMFDQVVQDQTTRADSIEVEITPTTTATGIGFINLSASEITIVSNDPTDGEVYNKTFSMVSDSGIINWWTYYFTPIERIKNLAVFDLPPTLGATLTITITDTGATAACGICAIGEYRTIGDTIYGANFSIRDYSQKTEDASGRVTITSGPYRDVADVTVVMQNSQFNVVKQLLTAQRSIPAVWVPDETRNGTIIYGFYDRFDQMLANPANTECVIRIEGLI